jgi:hypothetical protein
MGDGRRIRQQSQFTQLQRKAGLTDPISTNEKQRRVVCYNATFSKSSKNFHVSSQALPSLTGMNKTGYGLLGLTF